MLLKRISKDICLFGPKGSGKTMYMAYLGLLSYLTGETVYTNFRLKFPPLNWETESIELIMETINAVEEEHLILDNTHLHISHNESWYISGSIDNLEIKTIWKLD